jgi:hypothetical protein
LLLFVKHLANSAFLIIVLVEQLGYLPTTISQGGWTHASGSLESLPGLIC